MKVFTCVLSVAERAALMSGRMRQGISSCYSRSLFIPAAQGPATNINASPLPGPERLFFNQQATRNLSASPFDSSASANTANATKTATKRSKRRKFIPPKAAVKLTDKARKFFKLLLEKPPRPDVVGVMLNYNQASSGQPRMVFTFDFVSKDQISEQDEGVSLELLEDGTPKPPKDSMDDGLPKLYVNHNGFMKVLGCTLDIDIEEMKPILYDPSGNEVNPNV